MTLHPSHAGATGNVCVGLGASVVAPQFRLETRAFVVSRRECMQDRYVGDVGDFGKYGLLRTLGAGLSLGVVWYLVPNESHNADGKHTSYLIPSRTNLN